MENFIFFVQPKYAFGCIWSIWFSKMEYGIASNTEMSAQSLVWLHKSNVPSQHLPVQS